MSQTPSIADILKTRIQLPFIHKHIGDLQLPTGQLVACDPFLVGPRHEPFSLQLPHGSFPVFVSVESIAEFHFITHATIKFSANSPVRWKMMTIGDQDSKKLGAGEHSYPLDTGTVCFFDSSMLRAFNAMNRMWAAIRSSLATEMENPEFDPLNGFEAQVGPANLIAFPSGSGNSFYGTFAGFDARGGVCAVVTDF